MKSRDFCFGTLIPRIELSLKAPWRLLARLPEPICIGSLLMLTTIIATLARNPFFAFDPAVFFTVLACAHYGFGVRELQARPQARAGDAIRCKL